MWNCVMHMQQIEILVVRYGRHLRRQRQSVRLMFEQWVSHHLNFMKTHTLVEFSQTRGQGRRDEVHRVPALRQFLAQFRTDDAAAAIGWIDCDADVHGSVSSMQWAVSRRQTESVGSGRW